MSLISLPRRRRGASRRMVSLGLVSVALGGLGGLATIVAAPAAWAAAATPTVLVANGYGPGGGGTGTVTGYPDPPSGCSGTPPTCAAAPSLSIGGSATTLQAVQGIAEDSAGHIFVDSFSQSTDSIAEVAPGAAGNVAPVANLSGTATGINDPAGMVVNSTGTDLYALNLGNVTEYALPFTNCTGTAPATCDPAPVSTLTGASSPNYGMALDSSGDLYVSNTNNSVSEYAPLTPAGTSLAGRSTSWLAKALR